MDSVAPSNFIARHRDVLSLSDDEIIPIEIQHRLLYWRDVFTKGQFEIGDIAARLIEAYHSAGLPMTHQRIFNAMSTYCGKSPRTIRYYYETAIFFPEEVRKQYEQLPFSHFVLARYCGDRALEVLELSRANLGISLSRLEALVRLKFSAGAVSGAASSGGQAAPSLGVRIREFEAAEIFSDGARLLRAMLELLACEEEENFLAKYLAPQEIQELRQSCERALRLLPKVVTFYARKKAG